MKKNLALYSSLTLLLVALVATPAGGQVLNALTPALLQARAWIFASPQTFKGIILSGTTNAVTDGFKKDAGASGSLDTYKNSVLAWQNRGDHVIQPDCPADTSALEFGSFCKDLSSGTIKYRDAGGVKALP